MFALIALRFVHDQRHRLHFEPALGALDAGSAISHHASTEQQQRRAHSRSNSSQSDQCSIGLIPDQYAWHSPTSTVKSAASTICRTFSRWPSAAIRISLRSGRTIVPLEFASKSPLEHMEPLQPILTGASVNGNLQSFPNHISGADIAIDCDAFAPWGIYWLNDDQITPGPPAMCDMQQTLTQSMNALRPPTVTEAESVAVSERPQLPPMRCSMAQRARIMKRLKSPETSMLCSFYRRLPVKWRRQDFQGVHACAVFIVKRIKRMMAWGLEAVV